MAFGMAEHDGVVVMLSSDEGETDAMTADRAWVVASELARDPFASAASCAPLHDVARAWVWWSRRGCVYDAATMREVERLHVRMSGMSGLTSSP